MSYCIHRLSFWEELEIKRYIDIIMVLSKMKPNSSKYAYKVTLPLKKDSSYHFCGDYTPLNLQTQRDSFPMPLVEDVLMYLVRHNGFLL